MGRQKIPHKYKSSPMVMFGIENHIRLMTIVGITVSHSSEVEVNLALTMGSLLGVDNAGSVAVFTTLRNARARRDALMAAAIHSLTIDDLELFKAIMLVYENLDGLRNDIVHGVWGYIDGVDDGALWASTQNTAVWHINDYKDEADATVSYERRHERWLKYVYFWDYNDLDRIANNLRELGRAIGYFHAFLRYRDLPAGRNARSALIDIGLIKDALASRNRA